MYIRELNEGFEALSQSPTLGLYEPLLFHRNQLLLPSSLATYAHDLNISAFVTIL